MAENVKAALALLKSHSRNCDPLDLAGPSRKEIRRNVMQHLTGKRLPLAKCGVTAITTTFKNALAIQANNSHFIARELEVIAAL